MTDYHVCDHPELFVKNNVCHGCLELDGQEDALSLLEDQ